MKVEVGAGQYAVADFAYPDKKVLIFVDGMSVELHGAPAKVMKDNAAKAKLEMQGYHVLRIAAEALDDDAAVAEHLEELAVYLEG